MSIHQRHIDRPSKGPICPSLYLTSSRRKRSPCRRGRRESGPVVPTVQSQSTRSPAPVATAQTPTPPCSIPSRPLPTVIRIIRIRALNHSPTTITTPPLLLQQLPQIESRAVANIPRLSLRSPISATSRLVHVAITSTISFVFELREERRTRGYAEAGTTAEFVDAGVADAEVDGTGGLVGVEGVQELSGALLGDGVGLSADAFDG